MDPRQALYDRLRAQLRQQTAEADALATSEEMAATAPPQPAQSSIVRDYIAGKYDLRVSPDDLAERQLADVNARETGLVSALGRAGQQFAQAWGANNADPAFFDRMAQTAEQRRELVNKHLQTKLAKGADLTAARAKLIAERENKLTDDATQRDFLREEHRLNRISQERAAALSAGQKLAAEQRQGLVPGLEFAPGAQPTADDAKKMKASLASADRMRRYVQELRALHGQHGTELTGAPSVRMGQLMKAIQIEAKNISELGALSGPDMELMQSLSGSDPSSLMANFKGIFGVDNTDTALAGLEKWTQDTVEANKATLGYVDAPGAAPRGGKVRVTNGTETLEIDPADLKEAEAEGYRRL